VVNILYGQMWISVHLCLMKEIRAYSLLTGFIFLCNSDYSERGERQRERESESQMQNSWDVKSCAFCT